VIHRPIEDFLEAQETSSQIVWPFGDIPGWSGYPPGWSNPLGWPYYYPYWVYVDWTALAYKWLKGEPLPVPPSPYNIDLGTVITGDVMERSLNNGGRRVQVTLQGVNCWTIALICDFGLGVVRWPLVLGYEPEHIYGPGETPLLSECNMVLKWTDNEELNGPLPNVTFEFWGQNPEINVEQWTFDSNSGIGPLTNQPAYAQWELTPWETGTPGKSMIHEVVVGSGAWPIEICDVGPVENP